MPQKQVTMISNPFIIIGDIPKEYFCDRKKESQKLIQMLTNGENICLMSPRRMGKSKLIQFCYAHKPLCSDYYCFYIDIYHTTSLREFTYTFGKQVFNTLKTKSQKMMLKFAQALRSVNANLGFDPVTNLPKFSLSLGDVRNPEYTLDEIFTALEQADKPCIVCFDEFQQIANYPEKNIQALLRGHIQHLGNANFIFAGSSRHLLTEMFQSYAHPFYNSTSTLVLRPIDLQEYIAFATHWFEQYAKQIEPSVVEQTYSIMEGNTYYIQKTLHELFEQTDKGESCSIELLPIIIEGLIEEQSDGYRQLLSYLPDRHKEVLFAIAIEGEAEKVMGQQFIRRHSLASASAVQATIRKLLEMNLITLNEGKYSVPDVVFRMYLQRLGG